MTGRTVLPIFALISISLVVLSVAQSGPFFGSNFSVANTQPVLTGLQVWYKADNGPQCSGVCSDGGAVTTWSDKSGNGNDASSTGATASGTVIYHTNQLNGLPAVTFSSSSLSIAAQSPSTNNTALVVVKLSTTASESTTWGGANGGFNYWLANGTPMQGLDKAGVAALGHGTASADTSWHQMNITYNTASAPVFRINRAADATVGGSTATLTGNIVSLGCNFFNSSTCVALMSGQIAEIMYYNRILSGSEITQDETYLFQKWGV